MEFHEKPDSPEAKAILSGIVAYNDGYRSGDLRWLTVYVRDGAGEVSAGLNGYTDWGWLFVKLLWVRDDVRGTGFGSRLLAKAEDEARARGCHSAWLDSFSFQAPEFYRRHGYGEFGKLADYPRGHARHFFAKKL